MAKKKSCKKCKVITEASECPICKGTNLSSTWQGRVLVLDTDKSNIAKIMGFNEKNEYAIKVR